LIQLDYTNLPADRKKLRRRFYQDYLVMLGGMALTRPNDFLARSRTVDQFCRWSDISLVEMEALNYEPFTNLLWELEAGKAIALWKLAQDVRIRSDVRKVMRHLARSCSAQLRGLRKGDHECDKIFFKKRQSRVGVEPPKPPTLNPKWNPRAEPPEVD